MVDPGLPLDQPALLLEGSWPAAAPTDARWSLDDAIDGRYEWLDRQAAEWSELLGSAPVFQKGDRHLAATRSFRDGHSRLGASPPFETASRPLLDRFSPAYVHALALRYYLGKLLRPLVYLTEVRPLRAGDELVFAGAGHDADYADLLGQLCRVVGADFQVRGMSGQQPAAPAAPLNRFWRRWAGRLARVFEPDPARLDRRVVLCGNSHLLGSVCDELVRRGCGVWWLYDRFALRSWLQWRGRGVGQLVCDSSLGRVNRLRGPLEPMPKWGLKFRGVDLMPAVGRWLAERVAAGGAWQTRLIEQIDCHFARVRPEAVVLDEDATPLARIAVAAARHHGARSLVVQHGIPACRFGFAPLAADRILVWGRSSREQLIRWEVPAERVVVAGWPRGGAREVGIGDHKAATSGRGNGRGRERAINILLLATTPPRDQRPDAAALHLNGRSYAQMLRTAMAAVQRMDGARLLIRPHPRAPKDPFVDAALAEFPGLAAEVVRGGPLAAWLAKADCVLSCGSTGGLEAALAGVPAIGLVPPGACDWLPRGQWGLAGTARSQGELESMLAEVFQARRSPGAELKTVAESVGPAAAARIAEEVLMGTKVAGTLRVPSAAAGQGPNSECRNPKQIQITGSTK